MAFLAFRDPSFGEVVAVDANLELFGRAWCIAELAEAQQGGSLATTTGSHSWLLRMP